MTALDLQDHLVTLLVRAHGGTRRRWRIVAGPVRVHDRATHPHCNWSVAPSGSAGEVDAVETMLDRLRLERPIVAG